MEENISPENINILYKKHKFWHLVAENDLFEMVEKSGFGEYEFVLFQKRRLRGALLSTLAAIVPTILLSKWFAFTAILFFVVTWRNSYAKEKNEYQAALYEKQISWFVFQRLVSIYLKGENHSTFIAFNKVLEMLEESEFKTYFHRLNIDIIEDSSSVQPYMDFAKNAAGGTDSSLTFMSALYNFKNSCHDSRIIDELSDMARREMMRGIKDVRKIKERGLYFFPTKLTMLNVIPMIGYMIGVAYNIFTKSMNF
jgi:hypothetical protein